jgi:hypothetical protein
MWTISDLNWNFLAALRAARLGVNADKRMQVWVLFSHGKN